MRVALVNTNRMQPPIAPIGLDYVAEALEVAGHRTALLDLCWAEDPAEDLARFFRGADFGLVGVTLRNTDDCAFLSRQSFVSEFAGVVAEVRRHTDAPILTGGAGFSVMPQQILAQCAPDAGVWGEGEWVLPKVAARIGRGREWRDLPGIVARGRSNPPRPHRLADLPAMTRSRVDNARYFREGGQGGFETKRGCPCRCVYCADPVAKGRQTRTRPPAAVADEIERLLAQGIDHLHTCDPEFNLPPWHALAVCRELTRRGLGERLRWYAYCSPLPFSRELAHAMRAAGCAGINFGVDNGDREMLRRLGRGFTPGDIVGAVFRAQDAGMAVMLDLLLGSPGESRESLRRTVELVRVAAPERAGVSVGVRVYPGTELARTVGTDGEFFLEPQVAPFIFEYLDELIAGDPRFLFFDPARPDRNYNYNANQRLVDAIRRGHRGAYWDILRRCSSDA